MTSVIVTAHYSMSHPTHSSTPNFTALSIFIYIYIKPNPILLLHITQHLHIPLSPQTLLLNLCPYILIFLQVPMAYSSSTSTALLVLLLTIFWCSVSSFEFQVGGSEGWVVPPPNDTNIYNDWASHNRFRVGDSIRFKYKKDSVMEVSEEGYKNCNSSHPNMFSNNGNTVFRFEHPGSFYFISGASGHCHKGQKMIVRVLTQEDSIPDHAKSSAFRLAISPLQLSNTLFFHFIFAFVASYVV